MQKLLVSIRGKNEALEAVKGGAKIADAEYPTSALGTPYPLNIYSIRQSLPKKNFWFQQILVKNKQEEVLLHKRH